MTSQFVTFSSRYIAGFVQPGKADFLGLQSWGKERLQMHLDLQHREVDSVDVTRHERQLSQTLPNAFVLPKPRKRRIDREERKKGG
jgi:hypothetical protein